MRAYLFFLYKQYCEMLGKEFDIVNFNYDKNDFYLWINRNQEIGEEYKDFIQYLEIPINSDYLIEANKSIYDSIANENNMILSPFASSIGESNGSLQEVDGKCIMILDNRIVNYNPNNIDCVITQNPYSKQFLDGFSALNKNGVDICIGVYGSNYDKDKKSKIEFMNELKSSLKNISVIYETLLDNYYCIIKSYNVEKELVKIRKR